MIRNLQKFNFILQLLLFYITAQNATAQLETTDSSRIPLSLDPAEQQLFPGFPEDSVAGIYRNCFSQTAVGTPWYFWHTPQPEFGDTAWAQRFEATAPETIMSVEMLLYDQNNGKFGNDNLFITIYADDGFGLPGAQIAQAMTLAGSYPAYPALAMVDFSGQNVVVQGSYHVAFSTSGQPGFEYENLISSEIFVGPSRSSGSGDPNYPGWYHMDNWWGVNINFLFVISVCGDSYSSCDLKTCYTGLLRRWAVPNAAGVTQFAQKNSLETDSCRIDEIGIRFAWPALESGLPLYTHDARVIIYDDNGGMPGSILATKTIVPTEFAAIGLTHSTTLKTLRVDFAPFQLSFQGDYWIGVESLAPDSVSGIRILSDNGSGQCLDGFALNDGQWEYVSQAHSLPADVAMGISFGFCCEEPTLRVVPDNYQTIQSAILASKLGDTVLVKPGIYDELINFNGRRIHVASLYLLTADTSYILSTIISGNSQGPTVSFSHLESESSKLIGFTITHQNGIPGPGIHCNNSTPEIRHNLIVNNLSAGMTIYANNFTIEDNEFKENSWVNGGALEVSGQNVIIRNCIFQENTAEFGGAVNSLSSSILFDNNLFIMNTADSGSILFSEESQIDFTNCTIALNTATRTGLIQSYGSEVHFDKCVLAFNKSARSTFDCFFTPSTYDFVCTDIFGNQDDISSTCNLPPDSTAEIFSLNPQFCNPFNGDFNLNSTSPCLSQNSPCGSFVGALGHGCSYICGDADGSGELDLADVVFLNHYYFECDLAPVYFGAGDPNCDGKIDLADILFLSSHLNSNGPAPCCP